MAWQSLLKSVPLLGLGFMVPTLPAQTPRELVLPIVSIGPANSELFFETTFVFANLSDSTVNGLLVVSDDEGHLLDFFDSPCLIIGIPPFRDVRPVELKPGEVVRFPIAYRDKPFHGWAKFSWSGPEHVFASAELSLVDSAADPCRFGTSPHRPSDSIDSSTVLTATAWINEMSFPIVHDRNRETGLAIVAGGEPIAIPLTPVGPEPRFEVLDSDGRLIAEGTVPIRPLERRGLLISELVALNRLENGTSTLPDDFVGTVHIVHEESLVAGAIDLLFPKLKLVAVGAAMRSQGTASRPAVP